MRAVDAPDWPADAGPGTDDLERALWGALDGIPDPHMPVSIVELGMIYDVRVAEGEAVVEMTYPCMGCPAYGMIQEDIRERLQASDGVDDVAIDVVWDPVWSKDRLAADVREKLNASGIAL